MRCNNKGIFDHLALHKWEGEGTVIGVQNVRQIVRELTGLEW